ncbi:nucleoside-diphosphate sugar epimerase/dehydratase [Pseudonocardia sp. TRM90224]|uniref:nucleoside-diphosphate sugar epimerase/dehydratase n=1 Tax=Pseudonocardia sp. TRM90224 TaxID=2812678 RepID=UPI001E34C59D|nr:nucleoside-diphosphate sugar epimerase/dehydratase [Pseudonocardia sp. TRM90224]
MARITAVVGLAVFIGSAVGLIAVPRSVPITATLVTAVIALAIRLTLRTLKEQRARPDAESAARVIVVGAGVGGQQLIRSMLADAESGYLPVALLDDDPSARSRRISGVPVLGSRADIASVASSTGASVLVVAIRNLDTEVMREISSTSTGAGLRVQVIPALMDLFRPWIGFSDLRDLDITDLIGRRPIEVDVNSIAGYLTGKRVLVTGAGGSIGSELCRQLRNYGPAELLMLDRDESALHTLQLSIHGRALLDSPDVILADIRDAPTLTRILAERRPHVVFHAAALKHLPMLEQYPHEAWQSNVVGTANVLDAALEAGVETFVNISTDKAANPISVLGCSKRIGERLVAEAASRAGDGLYVSVRFGNVLGSRGSVLTTFAEQIATGMPITVTHPDVTRFFMTIPEAVRLVIQAAAIGAPGEALVLDMGEPVRIADIATQLASLAGRPVQLLFTGLREGEKLHEELFGDGEHDVRPVHPAVSHVRVPALDPSWVLQPVGSDTATAFMHGLTVLDDDEPVARLRPALTVNRSGNRRGSAEHLVKELP